MTRAKSEELGEKPTPLSTLSTIDSSWIAVGLKLVLWGERPATNHLSVTDF